MCYRSNNKRTVPTVLSAPLKGEEDGMAENTDRGVARIAHLLEIQRITQEQNKLLSENLDEESLGQIDELLAERQQHFDAFERLGDGLIDNREDLLSLLGEIRTLDEENARLAREQRNKIKARLEKIQQHKRSRKGYHDPAKLRDGAFVDTKR